MLYFLFDKEVKNGKMGSMGSMDTPTPKIQKEVCDERID